MLKKVSPISLIIIVSKLLGCSSTAAFIPTSSAPNTDPGGPAPTVTVPPGTDLLALARAKIKHIVVIMQENRSFDHYFGTYPGADGLPQQNGKFTVCVTDPKTGICVYPYHDPADKNYGGPHSQIDATMDINGGKIDGFIPPA